MSMTFFAPILDFYESFIVTNSQHLPRNTKLAAQKFPRYSVGTLPNETALING